MNLTELIAKVGMANIKIQRVDESIVRCKSVAGETHLTVATNQVSVEDAANLTAGVPLPVHGLILWIQREFLQLAGAAGGSVDETRPDWADRIAEGWIANSAAFGGETWKAELAKKVRAELERTLSGVVLTHEQAARFVKTIGAIRTALLKPEQTDIDQVNADLKAVEKELHAAITPPPK